MSWIQPLELQTWFVNVFAGSVEIFTFVSLIVIATMAAKFQMSNTIAMLMFVLFAIIMNTFLNLGGLYILILFVTGVLTFYSLSKLWE